jgi:hypothetical protein
MKKKLPCTTEQSAMMMIRPSGVIGRVHALIKPVGSKFDGNLNII